MGGLYLYFQRYYHYLTNPNKMAAKLGDIFIYGDIYNEQSEERNSAWGEVSLTSVKNQFLALPTDTTDLVVHIHSRGGDVYEGFAIHDYLRATGKRITTRIEGLCASIATIVALAGDERLMTKNSTFMIHNPSIGFAFGDADDMEATADLLRSIENKIIDFYSKKTSQSKETLDSWMKEEKFMTPKEAKELGFVTDIIEDISVAAVFTISNKRKIDTTMTNLSEQAEQTLQKSTSILDKIMNLFKEHKVDLPAPPENNLNLSAADGRTLEIVTVEQIPNPGNQVKIDGKAAEDGDYIMADQSKIVVKDGKVVSVTDPEDNTDTEAVAKLNAEIAALKEENKQLLTQFDDLNTKLESISSTIQSEYTPKPRTQSFNTSKDNAPENPVTAAIERRKERESKKK